MLLDTLGGRLSSPSAFKALIRIKNHRNKESKVNKLKGVLDHLDDLEYFHPHRHQEVLTKKQVVNGMIQSTLSEARQLIVRIAHGCEKCNSEE